MFWHFVTVNLCRILQQRPTILVSGKNGQLGNEFVSIHMSYPQYRFIFLDRTSLDLTDLRLLPGLFEQYRPAYFINTAAYTAVDKAETERDVALLVNGKAPGMIAGQCQKYGTTLIHLSTDYVFNGQGKAPYQPTEKTAPINFYGESKRLGELAALESNKNTIIIRTAWVYSVFGHNFVKTMLRLMSERSSIKVVQDQIGAPTYARDLAVDIMRIIEKRAEHKGIYHYSNKGVISWYDFACAIRDLSNLQCTVLPVNTDAFPTPAKRPAYSVLDTSALQSDYGITPRTWDRALKECLGYLNRL